jgi:hypothetical protein
MADDIPRMDHEHAFVAVFVVPEKRARYGEFLPNPNRRGQIVNRFCHFFDFVPALATQVKRDTVSRLAAMLRARGAGDTAHVIGGGTIDGKDLPLEQAIDDALSDQGGVVISCIPGRLALYMQEFPPGDTFILNASR